MDKIPNLVANALVLCSRLFGKRVDSAMNRRVHETIKSVHCLKYDAGLLRSRGIVKIHKPTPARAIF